MLGGEPPRSRRQRTAAGLVLWALAVGAVILANEAGGQLAVGIVVALAALGASAALARAGGGRPGDIVGPGRLLRALREAPASREPAWLLAAAGLASGLLSVSAVAVATELVQLGPRGIAVLAAAWTVGAIAGTRTAPARIARSRRARVVDAGAALIAVALALLAAAGTSPVAIAALAAAGLGTGLVVAAGRELGRRRPAGASEADDRLGRVAALGALALGALIATPLISLLGVRGALLAAALVVPAIVIARWRVFAPAMASAIR